MTKRTKIALVAGTAALALAGIGGGVAFAQGSSTPATGAVLTASTSSSTSPSTPAKPGTKGHHKAKGLLDRVEHGEVVLHTKQGDRTVDIQSGQVTAISGTTVTVRSQDGFSATYTSGSTSKIREKGQTAALSAVHNGDRVRVAATRNGSSLTITSLRDTGPAAK